MPQQAEISHIPCTTHSALGRAARAPDILHKPEVQGLVTGWGIQQSLLGLSLMQKEIAQGYLASAPSFQKWARVIPHFLGEKCLLSAWG